MTALSALTVTPEYLGVSYDLTTDTGSGALFYVVLPTGATAPSAEQIEAGTDGGDAAATSSGSAVVSVTDIDFEPVRNLASDTTYDTYLVQKVGSEYSNIVSDTFTTALVLASGAYDGGTHDINTFGVSTITENYADPDGGTDAILLEDDNGGGVGQIGLQLTPVVYIDGVNYFNFIIEKLGGNVEALRFRSANVTSSEIAQIDLSDGSIINSSFVVVPTSTDLGGGVYRVDAQVDMAGDADRNGAFILQMMEGGSTAVDRDGTQQVMFWRAFIADE